MNVLREREARGVGRALAMVAVHELEREIGRAELPLLLWTGEVWGGRRVRYRAREELKLLFL